MPAPRTVSFLDDLKRQAESLRDQQSTDESALQRRFDATEEACRTALAYLNALADQLQVLQPGAGRAMRSTGSTPSPACA